jgi:enoyl-CoA hydratase
MAKARSTLLCEPVSGEEAERMGWCLAVEEGTTEKAYEVADRLANGSQTAIDKQIALNNWLIATRPRL